MTNQERELEDLRLAQMLGTSFDPSYYTDTVHQQSTLGEPYPLKNLGKIHAPSGNNRDDNF